jgi:hypothetical protein
MYGFSKDTPIKSIVYVLTIETNLNKALQRCYCLAVVLYLNHVISICSFDDSKIISRGGYLHSTLSPKRDKSL